MISVFQFYGAGNDIPIQNSRLYQHPCFLFVLEFQGYGKIMVTFQTIRRFARISPEHEDVIVSIRPRACFFPLFSFLPLWLHYNLNPLCVQY